MQYNLNYGQLIDQQLVYAPKNLDYNGQLYIPASEAILRQAGYYQIVHTPYPDDNEYYISHWELRNDIILQVWIKTTPPEPPEPVEDPVLDLEEMAVDYEYRLTLLELGVE